MRLFEIDETHNVRPNKQWIALIPEFANLLKRDKGSKGDSEGRSKAQARKELAFIFFFCDFSSVIRDWLPEEKEKEAIYYSGLKNEGEEVDDCIKRIRKDEGLQEAIKKYVELQHKAARSLRTFEVVNKGLDSLDAYIGSINFADVDKKGEMMHDPNKFQQLIERMSGLYAKRREFEKFVEDDLKANVDSIQGNRTLGDQESKRSAGSTPWSELDVAKGSDHIAEETTKSLVSFADLAKVIHAPRPEQQLTDEELQQVNEEE